MPASRVIILGVAVAAAGGAGYVAKNMAVTPPPTVIVESGPSAPAIELTDVLVMSKDVPMGGALTNSLEWQQWPSSGSQRNLHHACSRARRA